MRNIFITGGAGYLGRAIMRVFSKRYPGSTFTVFSRDHGKHSYCQREFPQAKYIIGDIRDYPSLELAIAGHDTVIHCAAFKYVPQGETNISECHEINTMGSLNVARASMRVGVERVVGISTDKACQPINVYGITKLMMEKMFQEADAVGSTKFNLVRYGNVVSSTGSAIPIFRRQAREDKVITLTNPEMTRFWLTVYDGAELIDMALQEADGGTILVPRLPSISLLEMAKVAVRAEGMKDVGYRTVGLRFGEKIHEDLLSEVEAHYAESLAVDKSYGSLIRLWPVTGNVIENSDVSRYTSSTPTYRLSGEELLKMIQESPE